MTVEIAPSVPLSKSQTSFFKKMGPGLITGAADDDPSGIATYSQAGAQFGFNTFWTLLLTFPLMVGIQVISAKIGRVSGHGLATNIRRHYPITLLYGIVVLLLVANIINIAADISAIGAAVELLAGGYPKLYAVLFGILSLLLQIFVPYSRYVSILKWLTLALLSYVATVFVIDVPWKQVGLSVFIPRISWSNGYLTTIVAILGTTISPYMFFWQASQEVEDQQAVPEEEPLKHAVGQAERNFNRIKLDTVLGMGVSNIIAFFIMLTTAVTLHAHGITDVQSSSQAATALKPVAGKFAFALFSLGIIGTGMLAVPILAGSAAYAVAGALRWRNGLELKLGDARGFYGVIAIATLVGIVLCFTPIDPMRALYWSAVINGVIAVPIMAVMVALACNSNVMGPLTISTRLKVLGWLSTTVMGIAVIAMFCFSK